MADFLDVLVWSFVENGFASSIGKSDLTGIGHGDGWVGLLFAERALTCDGSENVAQVTFGCRIELRFALVAAEGDGLAVVTGDGGAGWLAGDGANSVEGFFGSGEAGEQSKDGKEGDDVFHDGMGAEL